MRAALLALLVVAACERKQPAPAPTGAPVASAPFYRVDVAPPPPCRAGDACTLRLALTALGDFHVNKTYPFKFIPAATDGITHEGTPAFVTESERSGTLTVTFRAAAPGTARITGTFKLSVCNEDVCEIEDAPVSVDVPVT